MSAQHPSTNPPDHANCARYRVADLHELLALAPETASQPTPIQIHVDPARADAPDLPTDTRPAPEPVDQPIESRKG